VRVAKPYLQPNLAEGSELHSRLLPSGELSFVTKIKTKQSTKNKQQIKIQCGREKSLLCLMMK